MELANAIVKRRSIRAFTAEEIPEDTIRGLLDEARWSPSWANMQDWNVHVVTGDALERLKAALAEAAEREPGPTDIGFPAREWPAYLVERSTYVRRPNEPARIPQRPGLWQLYGAPCLLLFSVDAVLAPAYACFDAGLLVQTVCLLAADRGLGTCIMAMAVRHPEALRSVITDADDLRFVVGVALGHPDPSAEVNAIQRTRVELDEVVRWLQ